MKSFNEKAKEDFEKYWASTPDFPVGNQKIKLLYKIGLQTAFMAGTLAGIDMARDKILGV